MLVSEAYARIDIARNNGGVYDHQTVLNMAGAYFYGCRPWRFAKRMTGRANLTAGVAQITLPLGCARIISIEVDGDAIDGRICVVDATRFNQERTSRSPDEVNYYATEEWAEGSDAPVRRLALHRTPGATVSAALRIAFEAEWTNANDDVAGDAVLPIPSFAEPAFGLLLDAFARGLEEDIVDDLVERTVQGAVFAQAIAADFRAVQEVADPSGGWIESAKRRTTDTYASITLNLTPP